MPSLSVAPYMGAWIETQGLTDREKLSEVAPYMGAWIETPQPLPLLLPLQSRTLYGCVD